MPWLVESRCLTSCSGERRKTMRPSTLTVLRPVKYVLSFTGITAIPFLLVGSSGASWLQTLAPLWVMLVYAGMLYRLAVTRPNGAFQEDTRPERQWRFLKIFLPSMALFLGLPIVADIFFGPWGGYVPEFIILMPSFLAASGLPALRMEGTKGV